MTKKSGQCRCGKADKQRKSPYADGCGYNKDSMAAEFNSIMINDAERADKPCGNSHIPQNAKCSKGVGSAAKAGSNPSNFSLNQIQGGVGQVRNRKKFYSAKATTKGIGNKIKRAGEFAANVGGITASTIGYSQFLEGASRGNIGLASRGLRNATLGVSATQLAGASKASRLGNKKLAKEFTASAGKIAGVGVGQEALLGGIAGYNRAGGARGARNRVTNLRNLAARRAQGVRSYRR